MVRNVGLKHQTALRNGRERRIPALWSPSQGYASVGSPSVPRPPGAWRLAFDPEALASMLTQETLGGSGSSEVTLRMFPALIRREGLRLWPIWLNWLVSPRRNRSQTRYR